jgi:hypothetical protein
MSRGVWIFGVSGLALLNILMKLLGYISYTYFSQHSAAPPAGNKRSDQKRS